MINKHGNYHIVLQNMSEDEAELIKRRSDVAASSWHDELNPDGKQDYYVNSKKTVVYGIEETYIADIMNYSTEGSYSQNDREIILSADAKQLFKIHVEDGVTINTPAGDFAYTISGFCEDDTEFNNIIGGSCVYMNMTAFDKIRSLNGADSRLQCYIQFKEEVNLGKTIDAIKRQYSLASENIDENTAVLGLAGASSNETIKNLYPLAVFCFFLILISGVLMISSCMNSNVAQRTKFFGMMRCIGASKQQIMRFVRLEALNWCKTAIPAGCLFGIVSCWILCAILRFFVKGE